LIRAFTAGSTGAAGHLHLVIALPPNPDLSVFVNKHTSSNIRVAPFTTQQNAKVL
jgi:hypothetical protein